MALRLGTILGLILPILGLVGFAYAAVAVWVLPLPYVIVIVFIAITVTSNLLSRIVCVCLKK